MWTRNPARWLAPVVLTAAVLTVGVAARMADRGAEASPPPAPEPVARPAAADCCGADVPPPRAKGRPVLRVSADPNNLPFTNDRREGFENKIADILAAELEADLEYAWRAQRRGFFRQALKEGECDVVLGCPVGFDMALTTAPYYRSSYVFVSRADRKPAVRSLDDPLLKRLRVGVQLVGDDGANTPPAHALAARGMIENVVGFTLYGDYREDSPPARIVAAVAAGEVDVAVAWGPMAGYFAKRQAVPLTLTPVEPAVDPSGLPFTFGIALGVRRGDAAFRDALDGILKKRKADIDRILDGYGVPRVAKPVPNAGERRP